MKPLAELTADELDADLRVSVGSALEAAQAALLAMRCAAWVTLLHRRRLCIQAGAELDECWLWQGGDAQPGALATKDSFERELPVR